MTLQQALTELDDAITKARLDRRQNLGRVLTMGVERLREIGPEAVARAFDKAADTIMADVEALRRAADLLRSTL